jgi:hypothetical protein
MRRLVVVRGSKMGMSSDQDFGGLPSAHSGNSSFGSYQLAASDRQMCTSGRSVIAVSRHPIRSSTVSLPSREATMCDPHCEQK